MAFDSKTTSFLSILKVVNYLNVMRVAKVLEMSKRIKNIKNKFSNKTKDLSLQNQKNQNSIIKSRRNKITKINEIELAVKYLKDFDKFDDNILIRESFNNSVDMILKSDSSCDSEECSDNSNAYKGNYNDLYSSTSNIYTSKNIDSINNTNNVNNINDESSKNQENRNLSSFSKISKTSKISDKLILNKNILEKLNSNNNDNRINDNSMAKKRMLRFIENKALINNEEDNINKNNDSLNKTNSIISLSKSINNDENINNNDINTQEGNETKSNKSIRSRNEEKERDKNKITVINDINKSIKKKKYYKVNTYNIMDKIYINNMNLANKAIYNRSLSLMHNLEKNNKLDLDLISKKSKNNQNKKKSKEISNLSTIKIRSSLGFNSNKRYTTKENRKTLINKLLKPLYDKKMVDNSNNTSTNMNMTKNFRKKNSLLRKTSNVLAHNPFGLFQAKNEAFTQIKNQEKMLMRKDNLNKISKIDLLKTLYNRKNKKIEKQLEKNNKDNDNNTNTNDNANSNHVNKKFKREQTLECSPNRYIKYKSEFNMYNNNANHVSSKKRSSRLFQSSNNLNLLSKNRLKVKNSKTKRNSYLNNNNFNQLKEILEQNINSNNLKETAKETNNDNSSKKLSKYNNTCKSLDNLIFLSNFQSNKKIKKNISLVNTNNINNTNYVNNNDSNILINSLALENNNNENDSRRKSHDYSINNLYFNNKPGNTNYHYINHLFDSPRKVKSRLFNAKYRESVSSLLRYKKLTSEKYNKSSEISFTSSDEEEDKLNSRKDTESKKRKNSNNSAIKLISMFNNSVNNRNGSFAVTSNINSSSANDFSNTSILNLNNLTNNIINHSNMSNMTININNSYKNRDDATIETITNNYVSTEASNNNNTKNKNNNTLSKNKLINLNLNINKRNRSNSVLNNLKIENQFLKTLHIINNNSYNNANMKNRMARHSLIPFYKSIPEEKNEKDVITSNEESNASSNNKNKTKNDNNYDNISIIKEKNSNSLVGEQEIIDFSQIKADIAIKQIETIKKKSSKNDEDMKNKSCKSNYMSMFSKASSNKNSDNNKSSLSYNKDISNPISRNSNISQCTSKSESNSNESDSNDSSRKSNFSNKNKIINNRIRKSLLVITSKNKTLPRYKYKKSITSNASLINKDNKYQINDNIDNNDNIRQIEDNNTNINTNTNTNHISRNNGEIKDTLNKSDNKKSIKNVIARLSNMSYKKMRNATSIFSVNSENDVMNKDEEEEYNNRLIRFKFRKEKLSNDNQYRSNGLKSSEKKLAYNNNINSKNYSEDSKENYSSNNDSNVNNDSNENNNSNSNNVEYRNKNKLESSIDISKINKKFLNRLNTLNINIKEIPKTNHLYKLLKQDCYNNNKDSDNKNKTNVITHSNDNNNNEEYIDYSKKYNCVFRSNAKKNTVLSMKSKNSNNNSINSNNNDSKSIKRKKSFYYETGHIDYLNQHKNNINNNPDSPKTRKSSFYKSNNNIDNNNKELLTALI